MINPEYITKIEGHGKLNIDFTGHKAKLVVDEGERLFEGLVLGRPYWDIPFIVSRICGICPTAHYLASLNALEKALNVTPSNTAIILRKILLLGQISQSHILHTVFLALPDYLNIDTVTDIAVKFPAEFSSALQIKKVSDEVVEIVGGRAVHPVTPSIGGFTRFPHKKDLQKLRDNIYNTLGNVHHLVKLFYEIRYPYLTRETKYLALDSDLEYAFLSGRVTYNFGYSFEPDLYKEEIKEHIVYHSTAKHAFHQKKEFMVGALARISLHPHKLSPNARKVQESFFANKPFPSYNSFHNNFAQMIEILHCFESMIVLIDKALEAGFDVKSSVDYKIKPGKGTGAIEAPRGTLYHYYELDKKGIIVDCDIITPTVQNLANLEKDANALLAQTKSLSNKKRAKLLEMLVRAYDPCITCSVH